MTVGTKVKVHMYDDPAHTREIKTSNYDKVFAVYEKNGKLGIDWDEGSTAWFAHEDGFRPLSEFSPTTVVFEEV